MGKNFNEMEEEDIVEVLNTIKERYNIEYYKVGYSKENMNNTILIVFKNTGVDFVPAYNTIEDIFFGLTDLDGNEIEGGADYDDIACPHILYADQENLDIMDRWIKRTERRGKITWLI